MHGILHAFFCLVEIFVVAKNDNEKEMKMKFSAWVFRQRVESFSQGSTIANCQPPLW